MLLYSDMRLWKEEEGHVYDYQNYKFGYGTYAELEEEDILSNMYAKGFLPMSNNNVVEKQFYEARSFRIPLEELKITSENRRVLRKFAQLPKRKVISASEFDFNNNDFQHFCVTYLEKILSLNGKQKLQDMLKTNLITEVVAYTDKTGVQGYVFLVQDATITHFWFSFYALGQAKKSFGVYMMLQEIQAAKELKKQYMYLGTCYGAKGRYKQNFKPFEYWDGNKWIRDEKKLKDLISKEK